MNNITDFPEKPVRSKPVKELAELQPITREELEEALSELGDVATLVGKNVVHCKALTIMAKLQNVEAVFLGMLPGGERFDHCEGCGASLGVDDTFVSDAEGNYLCPSCAATCVEPQLKNDEAGLCDDCPPADYPTDKTRCSDCPHRSHL